MQVNCTDPLCRNFGRYCRIHLQQPIKAAKAIPRISEKQKQATKEIAKIVRERKKKVNKCEIKSPVCKGGPLHAQHMKGRVGKNKTDARYIILACDPCNGYCSDHPAWAYEHGFSVSRLKK